MARSIKDGISSAFSDDPNGDFFRKMSGVAKEDTEGIPARKDTLSVSDKTKVAQRQIAPEESRKQREEVAQYQQELKDIEAEHGLYVQAFQSMKPDHQLYNYTKDKIQEYESNRGRLQELLKEKGIR